jgi:transposase
MDLLGLPGYRIIAYDEHEDAFHIQVELLAPPLCCVHYGSWLLYRHEIKQQQFTDQPIRGKPARLIVRRRRYRCRTCDRTFFEAVPEMDKHHFLTKRLTAYIEREALRRTFTSIANEVGLIEWTIRSIFRESTSHLQDKAIDIPVTVLGIDEVHLLHKPRCVLTDIEQRTILDLLRNRDKAPVKNYLQRLPASLRTGITCVCMDMWQPYKQAVNDLLPDAIVIVDHFHVVKLANTCLDTVRKDLRASLSDDARRGLMHDRYILLRRRADLTESQVLILETWIGNFPALRDAYWLKEDFFNIWTAETRSQAFDLYRAWQKRLPAELEPAFHPLLTAMENWQQEILAYFDHRFTNGPTEALNGLVKLAARMGRGYSFEAIRAKVLLTGGLRKETSPSSGEKAYQAAPLSDHSPKR